MERNYDEIAKELNYELSNYEGVKKQIVQIKNRAQSYGIDPDNESLLNGEKDKEGKLRFQGLEQIKDKQSRKIMKLVKDWPIWEEWLAEVPGIGPYIAGKLIRLYYFRFVPTCQKCGSDLDKDFTCIDCGEKAKGMGNLEYRIELREFPTISSWWHFMGRHIDGNGKMPKRKAGCKPQDDSDMRWSSDGRRLGYDIKEAFNKFKNGHRYKEYAEKRKGYRRNTHPDSTDGHRHNMAWNEAVKLFLSHFWQVARTLDGLPLTEPWSVAHGGHDPKSIIPPYYWNGD